MIKKPELTDVDPGVPDRRRPLAQLARGVYGIYALSLFALLIVIAAVLALVLPSLAWRRSVTRGAARFWLWSAALRLHVTGLQHLPPGSCVLVANHASYLDGIVMKAALPPRFSFVIKREAAAMPIVGLLLRRIGSEFVDRHTHSGRHRDARRVMQRVEQGHSLVFFPEGTFDTQPGLKRFHIGAFVTARYGDVPVVPTTIHGARAALPGDHRIPRPGPIQVEILAPVVGEGRSVEEVRDTVRRRILERLEEPDLDRAAGPARREAATSLRQ